MEINREEGELTYNGKVYELDVIGNEQYLWEIDTQELMSMDFKTEDFPSDLTVQTNSTDGFGTFLFYQLKVSKIDDEIVFVFLCRQPNKYWEGKYGLSTILVTLADVIKNSIGFKFVPETLSVEEDWKNLEVFYEIQGDFNLGEEIAKSSKLLRDLIKHTELILSGAAWRKEYEADEKLFCTEIIFPLLRKMRFTDVRFNHGIREYGKDFTFSEMTKFGNLRHLAIQVKAGNLRGNVNAEIDEILGQLNDAFAIPYYEVSANESRNISTFIIAISGHFTENAKDKIINKIPQHFKGCVYLIDRDKILELIEKYWK